MPMATYKVRILARAAIIRYSGGERDINEILDSYNLNVKDRALVEEQIKASNPEIFS
ncbi:hypothetical protein J19TS2_25980 [Cohnella xylanilytica]|uniref:hypothetical protein n=1 Tax=Cohnella xylanilytica TaxID=557555 RepID=UPI001B217EB4|nr:hypothetical protein [Cohnella xylanilytica]GIO13043.1 hypothetical protein J19TS2_25980 [Cohnella xylanilytica]